VIVWIHGGGNVDGETPGYGVLGRQPNSIILYAFDLLHLDGKDLRQQTLMERRASLKHLVGADDQSRIQFSDEFDGDGDALFKACAEQGLEGMSLNTHSHPIALAAAALGSRSNASLNRPLW
jgi:hypothetical protein